MNNPTTSTTRPDTPLAPSLHAFLAAIVDYAGLFPPASLSLDDALRNYARYRTEPESWMLARFVIPVRRLPELDAYADLFTQQPPFTFSVLGTGGSDATAFLQAFDRDLKTIDTVHQHHSGHIRADVMEVRLPMTLLKASADALRTFFRNVDRAVATSPLPSLHLFFEIPLDDHLADTTPTLLPAMAAHNEAHPSRVGFKMRTGGTEPEAFPEAATVALALTACQEAGVPFKATAGLHHPVRAYHESVQAPMFGFFNVFGAALLTMAHRLDPETVSTILVDENPAHFHFTPDAFAWKHLTVPLETIRQGRRTFAISFGSCSFDEPREDLQALGFS